MTRGLIHTPSRPSCFAEAFTFGPASGDTGRGWSLKTAYTEEGIPAWRQKWLKALAKLGT